MAAGKPSSHLATAAVLLLAARAAAVPVYPATYTLAQPDGTIFGAADWGDERAHGVETVEGYTIVHDAASGYWVYATLDSSGALVPSGRIVGRDAPANLPVRLRPAPPPPRLAPGPAPAPAGAPALMGTHRLLILLVEFTPAQSRGSSEADWAAHGFYGGIPTAPRSVADYWYEVSYGQIVVTPAEETWGTHDNGVVEVTLPGAHPDTSGGNANRRLTADAIVESDDYVDYSAFDDNGDGYLNTDELHLLIVARGYERAYGGSSACSSVGAVWGHHWSLYGSVPAPTVDGVVVGHPSGAPTPGPYQGGYSQIGEWHCANWDNPGHMATIGISVHELGHDMGTGVPDLYDTDGGSSGIGRWALQAGGSWNSTSFYAGITPAWPDAWSRWYLGIITPAEPPVCAEALVLPEVETATGAPDYGVVRLRDNPGGVDWEWGNSGSGEYFLIENRQRVGFDAALPGEGLLIWHIDESVAGNNSANANEGTCPPGNRRLVVLEQADGEYDLECFTSCGGACNRGDGGDPWRDGGATTFGGATTPSSSLYGGGTTDVSVTGVSASGPIMTADLVYGPCGDGDPCTSQDACDGDECVGTPYTCDDGDVCTDDSCNGDGTCTFAVNAGPCNDGDSCTSGDSCADGTCSGEPYVCDDGDVCTDDSCNGDGTCTFVANTAACVSANPCAIDQEGICTNGVCLPVQTYDCTSADPCFSGACDGHNSCIYTSLTGPSCDDGNPCTADDFCSRGHCAGWPYRCDDGKECTTDSCDGHGGCTFDDRPGRCRPDVPCALGQGGFCVGSECAPDIVYACSSPDPCIEGTCDGNDGCIWFPRTGNLCDDGDDCTHRDLCDDGTCVGTQYDCDDGNPCTDDSCDGDGSCSFTDNTLACDDGDDCTYEDGCTLGSCAGTSYECDDDNPCTTDRCLGNGECDFAPNTLSCDDGDPCTVSDTCADRSCVGVAYSCDDGDPCTEDACDGEGACSSTPIGDCRDLVTYLGTPGAASGCSCALGDRHGAPPLLSLLAVLGIAGRRLRRRDRR